MILLKTALPQRLKCQQQTSDLHGKKQKEKKIVGPCLALSTEYKKMSLKTAWTMKYDHYLTRLKLEPDGLAFHTVKFSQN